MFLIEPISAQASLWKNRVLLLEKGGCLGLLEGTEGEDERARAWLGRTAGLTCLQLAEVQGGRAAAGTLCPPWLLPAPCPGAVAACSLH